MNKELEQRLVERFPGWFDVTGDPRHTVMPFGFQCGDGWFDLVWRLCVDLEPIVQEYVLKTGKRFEVLEVKQKLGGLRFFPFHKCAAIQARIEKAGVESFRTCEVCGQAGRLREWRCLRTLCDRCASQAKESDRP